MADSQRPLAPAPHGRNITTTNDPGQPAKPKRTNIGIACVACKARKLKCSGHPPCDNCLKNHTQCTVDRTGDKRRKSGIKRRLEVLEDRKDLLLELVRTLRDSSGRSNSGIATSGGGDRRMLTLLDLVRGGASLAEIRLHLGGATSTGTAGSMMGRTVLEAERRKAGSSRLVEVYNGDGEDHSQVDEVPGASATTASTRTAVDPEFLADIPRFDVPAMPWTTVVRDDKFVSQLVSLWFTWCHPFFNWVDRGLFLRDMRSGNTKARFCSPCLVNAMLAVACTNSNHAEVYAVPGDMAPKGAHFYHEAKRLLEEEEGRITLPTVQGLGLLTVYAGLACKDRYGWVYQSHLAYAVRELCHQNPLHRSSVSPEVLQKSRMVEHTSWGLFNIITLKAFAYQKIPPIQPPNRPLVSSSCSSVSGSGDDTWYPYPMQLEGIPAHTGCIFQALSALSRIVYDLTRNFYGARSLHPVDLEQRRQELRTRLRQWMEELPSCVREPEQGIQLPHLLCLHMYYHTVCITIDQHAHNTHINTTANAIHHAHRISVLTLLHRTAYGPDRIPLANIFWITTALITLLPHLSFASNPCLQNRSAFVNLAVAAKAFSRRWVLGRTKVEVVQNRAREIGVEFPGEVGDLFVEDDNAATTADGAASGTAAAGPASKRVKVG